MRFEVWTCVLFLALTGCKSPAPVTVSGAVQKPGAYAFQPGEAAVDYIRAAGGYTDEALADDAYVVRNAADSTDDMQVHTMHFPLSDGPDIRPGDGIRVPAHVYPVRLDTVRLVRDVRLPTHRELFRIERGVLVPGWTARGAVVAMLFGRGRVYDLPDTVKAVSAFHYLYLHFNPDQYARVLAFAGDPVDSLEALEDAHAVHQWLFSHMDYQTHGAAEVPPPGYFEVLQGVWLVPKTASFPGAGMRKRRFDDGRIWTTFRDGRQRWQYPDGRVTVAFPGGQQEVRYRDGRVAVTDVQGNVHTIYRDGREMWRLASGGVSTFFPDGRIVRHRANGVVFTREKDGTERTDFADGSLQVHYADGRVFLKEANGQTETRYPDGRRVVVTPEKYEITLLADGRQITRKPNGTVTRYGADGSVARQDTSGTVTHISADGVRRDVFSDGTTMVTLPDGSRTVRYLQGNVLQVDPDGHSVLHASNGEIQESFPDGHMVKRLPTGASVEAFPDGHSIWISALGYRLETFADGKRTLTLPGTYGYPGALRPDLVRVDSLPGHLGAGAHLTVRGTADDAVREVYVAAFRIPDGDVIEAKVHLKGRAFEGDLTLDQPGDYRVQVQVELSEQRSFTAVHHALVVGDAAPVARQVLALSAYPGDAAAAQWLIDRADAARARLGRRSVKADADLMRIAGIRLREMLLRGEVSHLSSSGEDVKRHIIEDRLSFTSVGENVADAPYLEAMHAGWMLSAGHRRNILDKRWTAMGAAVTEVAGSLWGVEVFAGW